MSIKCPKCQADNPETASFCADCGTKLTSSEGIEFTETLQAPKEELTTGSTFAERYQIIEELGKGGMGKVYKAFDKEINTKIALKLIKPEIASDPNTIERFRNELRTARDIVHKNVCRMYDLNKEEGSYYITMEYVSGEDLKSFIKRSEKLTVGKAVSVAKQVCDGLAEAHSLGVVHRDLKPGNIMIDTNGNARIMDFGIARSLTGRGITDKGVMIGTPDYMSPEQVEGKDIDQRTDIYSLGVILYEMVTGRLPFEGETALSIAHKQKYEKPQEPKTFNPQIPGDLNAVILKCLEKDKERRYQSAGDLMAELENIEKGIPTTEKLIPEKRPLTSREITLTFGLKRVVIPGVVFVALVFIGVLIWRLLPKKETAAIASGKPSLAVLYFENNTGDENLEYLRSGLAEWLITDLSQSRLIDVLSGDKVFSILKDLNLLEAAKYSSENLVEVAREGNVSYILKGSYIKIGGNFVITAMLQKPGTGELISSKQFRCRGEEEIPQRIDELTRTIKSDLNISRDKIADDIDKDVGTITTSSPEAYKYYSEARKYHNAGDNKNAIQQYEKAVEIDPDFAMAYRGLETAYNNMGYFSKGRECARKALELADRLSDSERYIVQAQFYWGSEKTYDKAIEAFTKLLEIYPRHNIANTNLGVMYVNIEEWDKAIERFEFLIRNKDETYFPYFNIAGPYAAIGMYDKARQILESYLENFRDDANIRWALAGIDLIQHEYDSALAEIDKAQSISPGFQNIYTKGYFLQTKGNFMEAEKEYMKLLESDEPIAQLFAREGLASLCGQQGRLREACDQMDRGIEQTQKLGEKGAEADFHNMLSYYHLRSGDLEAALKECGESGRIASEWEVMWLQENALYLKAMVYLAMKSVDRAQNAAFELRDLIGEELNKKRMRLYDSIAGRIELEKKNYSQALEYLWKSVSLLPYENSERDDHALF
ncbi:MAG: protein kinase, partial [Candidatus Aminicenantes bacterium]|nr:protein kinase [Candidatus Aminicenantes bacterium]